MKFNKFQDNLEKRLGKEEVAEIEKEAVKELEILGSLQDLAARAINNYIDRPRVGFNDLVKRLGVSTRYLSKIRKGEANLTLSTLARILAVTGHEISFSLKEK